MAKVALKIDHDEIYERLCAKASDIGSLTIDDANSMIELSRHMGALFVGTSAEKLFEEVTATCRKIISVNNQKRIIEKALLKQFVKPS